ncbi:hypothetical protein ACFWGI_37975 [Streptomyces niveus]|uniref:hypothetical protein n=1 Tax=Streptomyces niveus TaxID=193462 RepID=UPI0036544D79
MNANRTRYHVGMNEIGFDPVYRVECLGDLDAARVWLTADIDNTSKKAAERAEFDTYLGKLARTPDAAIVGEHTIYAYTFWVRVLVDCGCPCKCAATGKECNGEHNREAADEPKLAEPDEQGRSAFEFDGTNYSVYNTAAKPADGYWAVERVITDASSLSRREDILIGQKTRDSAFALAVDKLRPTRLITFLPRIHNSITDDEESREANAHPTTDREGWTCAWSSEGYAVVFENGVERGIAWPGRPIEASVNGADGRPHDLDGEWTCHEQAVAAVRAHVLDSPA